MHPPEPPHRVERPLLRMEWNQISFLHWRYDPAEVAALLPPGLVVDSYDGSAWVGLVPFRMVVRPPAGPALPWLSRFPETNVRTYVLGPNGEAGVWFFSLDAARLAPVTVALSAYQLPYRWARMSVHREGSRLHYRSERTWPGPAGARSRIGVQVGPAYAEDELADFDHYLTARFRLWSRTRGRLAVSRAEHPRWPLRRAEVVELDEDLVRAAGLPAPRGEPVVHFSEGVPVRVGPPVWAGSR